ncbi:MAG: hypothetical protein AMJ66_06310 [Betaproteobacteria bacterium SG8_40]|jgi:uncharacterized membrane protein|nr:MAG: hypothetical protein AMJ66_06310 [Betaproteobacteria bacterium SG8_40]
MIRPLYLIANGSLLLLIALCIGWELFLAPLRPGGSWLVLKALPLLAPLPGLLVAKRYTCQWASLLSLAYFIEGVVRAYSDSPPSSYLAAIEIVLATALFFSLIFLARELGRIRHSRERR